MELAAVPVRGEAAAGARRLPLLAPTETMPTPLRTPTSGGDAVDPFSYVGDMDVDASGFDDDAEAKLNGIMFKDARWQTAIDHLASCDFDERMASQLLERGAQMLGIWPNDGLLLLRQHFFGKGSHVTSPVVVECCGAISFYKEKNEPVPRGYGEAPSNHLRRTTFARKKASVRPQPAVLAQTSWVSSLETSTGRKMRIGIVVLASGVSLVYGILFVNTLFPDVPSILGWQVVVSRATAMGMGMLSSLLYVSMSRTFLTRVSRSYASAKLFYVGAMCDAHKELHMFAGRLMVVFAIIHTIGHIIGTAPGLITHTPEELNLVFGCANPHKHKFYVRIDLGFLCFPKCPITMDQKFTFLGVLFKTTPGLTGIFLWIVLALMAWTGSNSKRKANFERFYYIHNVGLFLWPFLLFWHGALGLVGFGIPLAMFFVALPVPVYLYDRIRWRCRRLLLGARDTVLQATVLTSSSSKPSMVKLEIGSDRIKGKHRAGMYAFICFPEYSALQWHPFTICSAEQERTVDFIIANAGDWTNALIQACQDFHEGVRHEFPVLQLDGPYSAPTQRFSQAKVLVAVGAGAGITPFLAMLSHLISVLKHDEEMEREEHEITAPKQAHLIWMTRNAEEFLFGQKPLKMLLEDPFIRDRVVVHLHLTAAAPDKHGPAYLFREAVRRQSVLDRTKLKSELNGNLTNGMKLWRRDAATHVYSKVPWCWLAGIEQDVLWLKFASQQQGHRTRLGTLCYAIAGGGAPILDDQDVEQSPEASAFPVVFGRPDFAKVIRSVGAFFPEDDIELYVCGNDTIVRTLKTVCEECRALSHLNASKDETKPAQQFILRFERFG